MVSITKTTLATGSAVIIKEDPTSRIRDGSARMSKTGTLDGGAVIDHRGYAAGDRSLEIVGRLDKAESDLLWSMFKTETMVNISTNDGFFYGAIERLRIDNGNVDMVLSIQE